MAERDLNSTRTQNFFGYKKSTARTGRNGLCYNRIAVLFFYITLWQQRMGHPPHGIPMCKLRHALVRLQWPVNLLLCPAMMAEHMCCSPLLSRLALTSICLCAGATSQVTRTLTRCGTRPSLGMLSSLLKSSASMLSRSEAVAPLDRASDVACSAL